MRPARPHASLCFLSLSLIAVEIIKRTARTRTIRGRKILVLPVEGAVGIRTGERDKDAI